MHISGDSKRFKNEYRVSKYISCIDHRVYCPVFGIDLNISQQINSPHRVSAFPHPHSGSVGLSPASPHLIIITDREVVARRSCFLTDGLISLCILVVSVSKA